LDEPTAALGVKESGVVLRYIAQARERGLAVVFITHNAHHAYAIGDRFTILTRGRSEGTFGKDEISRDEVIHLMAGGAELEDLAHELERSTQYLTEDRLGCTTARCLTRFRTPCPPSGAE